MSEKTKICPHCGEEILAVARKCKHCHERLEGDSAPSPTSELTLPQEDGTIPLPEIKRILGGRYELFEELGRGGMGVVYRARDIKLNTDVAIKLMPEHLASDKRGVDFLKREALASMKLSHPNILRLHHFEDHPEGKFLIMEYVDGKNLSQIQSESPNHKLSEEQVVKYAVEACDALHYAHTELVIHRDIKPSNMMIDSNGRLKIADFGIARIIKDSHTRHTGTITGGTLLYMSPEQIQGETVDARSDIYSLGISLYELLKGEVPFRSGDITHQHLHKTPPPIEGISNQLNKIILKCLEKKAENRFQSVAELKNALEGKATTPIESTKTRKLNLKVLVPAAVLLIVVVAGIFLVPGRNTNVKARDEVAEESPGQSVKPSRDEIHGNAEVAATEEKVEETVGPNTEEPMTMQEEETKPPVAEKQETLQLAKNEVEGARADRAEKEEPDSEKQSGFSQSASKDTATKTQIRSPAPTLLGSWQSQTGFGILSLVFQSETQLLFDGEAAYYTLLPGIIRVQGDYGPEDYHYVLNGDTLFITFPEGYQLQFTRVGGAPSAQPGGFGGQTSEIGLPTETVGTMSTGGDANIAAGEVGDPNWGFKFTPPKGWKYQKSLEGALLGHDTIAGALLVIPHMAKSFQEVQAEMQKGLAEDNIMLFPAGALQPLGNNAIAGEYTGTYEGYQVKGRGIGTFSPYGGGAYILGLTYPDKYGSPLSNAADSVAKSMRYFKVSISDLVQHFAGTWVHVTPNTMTSMTLAPNGDYLEDYEASYGGQFSDQYGYDAGNWGTARQDQTRARWTVRGNKTQGVIIINYPNGNQSTLEYRVFVEKGQTYWTEYLFNGTHYAKKR